MAHQTSRRRSTSVPQVAPSSLHHVIQHYPQTTLRWVTDEQWMPRSQVVLSRQKQPHDAILFIHGFGGDAGRTWENFPQVAAMSSGASRADLFFLHYPSLTPQVPFCAAQLLSFLIDVTHDPVSRIINPSLPNSAPKRAKEMRYRRIFIVAHSMGAVISRRAIMDLGQASDGFTDVEMRKFTLLFFAPAHAGSSIPRLIASGFNLNFPCAELIGSLASVCFQSLRDLEVGSPFLVKLANDCRELREARTKRHAPINHLRALVYHAQNDRVVSQNGFDQDPPFKPIMNKNHRSICKPNESYCEPIEALHALLAQ
ncbi:esterase/lipase family protein [Bradyrhizobium sp. McL0615]|uniref:esterase/lipase family protein n=1 Tax=Bradyrhizobium sp. McL0615 TaxID=3415673 RepID=UPI003CF4975A